MSFPMLEGRAFWFGLGVTVACEIIASLYRRAKERAAGEACVMPPRVPQPALAAGLCGAAALLAAAPPASVVDTRTIAGIAIGGMFPLAAGLLSDIKRPSSERHLAALAAGVAVAAGVGVLIPYTGFFGIAPAMEFAPIASLAVTALWFFIVASIVELAGLFPAFAGLVALVLSGLAWGLGAELVLPAGEAMPPLVFGAVLGRAVAGIVFGGGRMLDKSEVLTLGYFCAVLTTLSFTKSFAIASVILPIGLVAVVIVILVMRAFERSLLLRPTPRGEG
jgi:hypothetical protein